MFSFGGGKMKSARILLWYVTKKWNIAMSIVETQVQSPSKVTEMLPYTKYVL